MPTNSTQVSIDIVADATDAARAFDDVSASARSMGDTVERAGRDVDAGADHVNRAASAAENLDDKGSRATGAMGALAAGFTFLGAEDAAAGLETAAMATDGLSGAGQALSLVMELESVQMAKAKVQTIAKSIADKAQAATTWVVVGAQKALNLAMRANPIGLAITAAILLVGLFVLLYKRSDRFRAIVQTVMAGAKRAIDAVVAITAKLVGWVKDKVPAAFDKVRDKVEDVIGWIKSHWPLLLAIITGPIGLAVLAIVRNWDRIRDTAVAMFDRIRDKVTDVAASIRDRIEAMADRIVDRFQWFRDKATDAVNALLDPIRAVIDVVDSLLDKISSISLPHLSNPFGRVSTSTSGLLPRSSDTLMTQAAGGGDLIVFNFPGGFVADEDTLAKAVTRALARRARRLGANA